MCKLTKIPLCGIFSDSRHASFGFFLRPDVKKLQELLFSLAFVVFCGIPAKSPALSFSPAGVGFASHAGRLFPETASKILPGRGSGAACDLVEEKQSPCFSRTYADKAYHTIDA